MKIKMVERKEPENYKDCDQLMYGRNCGRCAFSDYAHSPVCCGKRKSFYNQGIVAGQLRIVRDSNREEYFEEIV
jgi:hypothetical protein